MLVNGPCTLHDGELVIAGGTGILLRPFHRKDDVVSGQLFTVVEIDIIRQLEGEMLPVIGIPARSQLGIKLAVLLLDQGVIHHLESPGCGAGACRRVVGIERRDLRVVNNYDQFFPDLAFAGFAALVTAASGQQEKAG